MVQSVCLTSRGSGVRLPLLPPPGRANQSKILKSGDFGIFCFIPSATVLRAGSALSFLEQALLCRSEFYSVLNEAPLLSSWNATVVCQHKRSRRRSEGSGAPLRVSSPTDGDGWFQLLHCTHPCRRKHISRIGRAYLDIFMEICSPMMPLGVYIKGQRCISLVLPRPLPARTLSPFA